MDAERWKRTRALFDEAAELPPARWAAFLERNCDDPVLAAEVLALLRADAEAASRTSLSEQAPDLFAGLQVDDDSQEAQQRLGQRYGAWRLVRALAEGGMGVVYLAERVEGDFTQRAALKVVRNAASSADVLTRFRYERQILANLAHPNIARLLDGGAGHDGEPYLAMEYVEGSDLRSYCDDKALDVDARLRLFLTVCDAVAYAHDRLVLHRDLKPTNVLVSQTGEVKLLDFGVAKLIDQQQPAEATVAGGQVFTPEYAAPEQIRGEISTVAVDVYALGVMLYELLTGRRPYRIKGRGAAAIERAVLSTDAPPPSTLIMRDGGQRNEDRTAADYASVRSTTPERLRQQLRGDLDAIVLKALRKSPQERYATVAAFAGDLRAHLARRPVTARRGSRRYRMLRFVQRHAASIVLVSLAALSLIAGSILAIWQAREAGRQRDAAVAAREISETEALKSKTTLTFMNRLFEQADPSRTRGATMTAREILDKGAQQIRKDLTEQPEVRADMMTAIGKAQLGLGLYNDALPLLQEAATLNRDSLIPHAATSMAYVTALARLGRPKDTLPILEPLRERLLAANAPPESVSVVDQALGSIYERLQRLDDAEAAYRRALETEERVLGIGHRETQGTLLGLADLFSITGRNEEARALAERVVTTLRDTPDKDPAFFALCLRSLARVLNNGGLHSEAEPLRREALAVLQNLYGNDHPVVYGAIGDLARTLAELDRPEEAIALQRVALEGYRKHYGADSYWTTDAAVHLAHVLVTIGRSSEARPLVTEAIRVLLATFGESHYRTAQALSVLGSTELAEGRFAAAEAALERALAAWEPSLGRESPHLADALNNLTLARLLGGRVAVDCEPSERVVRITGAESNAKDIDALFALALRDACLAHAGDTAGLAAFDARLAELRATPKAKPYDVGRLSRLSDKLHEKS